MLIQFLQDVTSLSLDGKGANVELRGYFPIRLPFNQELQDLPLTACKQVIRILHAFLIEIANIVSSQDAAYLWTKELLILRNRLYRINQIDND